MAASAHSRRTIAENHLESAVRPICRQDPAVPRHRGSRRNSNAAFDMHSRFTFDLDFSLQTAIRTLDVPEVIIGHRLISKGDEHALMLEEVEAFANSVAKVRRASGSARIVARQLLAQLGYRDRPVPKAASGAPIWPDGVVGSMSHDFRIAVAAVGMSPDVAALGIDIEPAEFLPSDLLELVATPQERQRIADDPYRGRLLFSAKEAVYKAVYPLDHKFLEHQDIEVDLAGGKAQVRNGRTVALRFSVSSHLVALAYLLAKP